MRHRMVAGSDQDRRWKLIEWFGHRFRLGDVSKRTVNRIESNESEPELTRKLNMNDLNSIKIKRAMSKTFAKEAPPANRCTCKLWTARENYETIKVINRMRLPLMQSKHCGIHSETDNFSWIWHRCPSQYQIVFASEPTDAFVSVKQVALVNGQNGKCRFEWWTWDELMNKSFFFLFKINLRIIFIVSLDGRTSRHLMGSNGRGWLESVLNNLNDD